MVGPLREKTHAAVNPSTFSREDQLYMQRDTACTSKKETKGLNAGQLGEI